MNYFCVNDIGLHREKNQDSYCTVKNKKDDSLLLVCDGIGGGKAGDVASGEAIKYFLNSFKNNDGFADINEAKTYLANCVEQCNNIVYKLSIKYKEYSGMGTTLTGLLICEHGILVVNVGDSRVYGYIDGKQCRLTVDDTLVNQMLNNGEITYEESLVHPKRHYLVKAIGIWDKVEPDIHQVKTLDYYLVCSDGLYNCVNDEKMDEIMTSLTLSAEQKANSLLKEALLNGGYDNITIIVVDVNG